MRSAVRDQPKVLACSAAARPNERQQPRVVQQPLDDGRVVLGAMTVDEDPGDAVAYGGGEPSDVGGHHGSAAGLRLQRHQTEGLVVRRDAHHRRRAVVVGELRLTDRRHEAHDVAHAEPQRQAAQGLRCPHAGCRTAHR